MWPWEELSSLQIQLAYYERKTGLLEVKKNKTHIVHAGEQRYYRPMRIQRGPDVDKWEGISSLLDYYGQKLQQSKKYWKFRAGMI